MNDDRSNGYVHGPNHGTVQRTILRSSIHQDMAFRHGMIRHGSSD